VVFVSSTGVYAQRRGEWVDEDSSAEPEGHAGRRLLEGERIALGSPFQAVVLRAGGIYGPGRAGAIERALFRASGDGPPVYTNRIHRDDLAGVLRHLMLLPEPESLYLGVDHEPADRRAVAEWLASRLGPETPRRAEPALGRARSNKHCSNARLVASGYSFLYPTFREGFAAVLEEMDVLPH